MKNHYLKRGIALAAVFFFLTNQLSWGAEPFTVQNGNLKPAADPFQTTQTAAVQQAADFFAASPLSEPVPALPPARISLNPTSGLTVSNITTLSGSPRVYISDGSASDTALLASAANQVEMGYKNETAADFGGLKVSFDNASTAAAETQSISALSNLTFGLKGDASVIRLRIEDANGSKDEIDLTGVSASVEKFWRIQISALSSSLDKTKIKSIQFLTAGQNGAVSSGKIYVRAGGLNMNAPALPVVSSTVPAYTNQSSIVLSGTKEAYTSIWINNIQVAAADASTSWTASAALSIEGANSVSIVAKNQLGKASTAKTLSIVRDTAGPTGSITINSGAAYTASSTVTLSLSASDSKSGVNTMMLSSDGMNWSAPETYKTSKSYVLPAGEGVQTVYVRFTDKAGNVSAAFSKSIVVDTLPPAGSISINGGAAAVNQTFVTLNLQAADAGMGVTKMSFSSDGKTWTAVENYAAQKNWTLTAGDGAKNVYVRYQDASGKWSSNYSASIKLDTMTPSGSFTINNGASFSNNPAVQLFMSGYDSGSGVNRFIYSFDGTVWSQPQNYQTPAFVTLPAGDGFKAVSIKFMDAAGNLSGVITRSIILDVSAPSGSFTIQGGAAFTTSPQITLNIAAADGISGVSSMSFSEDGNTWTVPEVFASVKSWALSAAEGMKQLFIRFYDKAGNQSESIRRTIMLDTIPPQGDFKINQDAAWARSRDVNLNLHAEDTGSGVSEMQFSFNGTDWQGYTAYADSYLMTLPAGDGSKTVYARFRDYAGRESAVISKTIALDSVPPQIQVQTPISALTNQRTLIVEYTVDGALRQKTFQLNEGTNTLSISETDAAGNSSAWSSGTALDTIPPQLEWMDPPSVTHQSPINLRYKADGTIKEKSFFLVLGVNVLAVNETDAAGNTSTLTLNLNYTQDYDIAIAGGGLQHFDDGLLAYQTAADGSRVDFGMNGKISGYSMGEGRDKVVFLEDGTIEIRSAANELLKTVLKIKQPAPDLSNAVKAALQNGIEVYYVDGVIKEMRTPTGIRIFDLTVLDNSASPELLSGTIVYPDGSFEIIWNKQLIRRAAADGSISDFLPDGSIGREFIAGHESVYVEIFDENTGLKSGSAVVSDQNDRVHYDEKGILKSIQASDGRHFVYERTQSGDFYLLALSVQQSSAAEPETLVSAKFDLLAQPVEWTFQNGNKVYFENGRIKQSVNAAGAVIDYVPLLSNGIAGGVRAVRGQTSLEYDAQGFLTRVKAGEGTLIREQQDSNQDGVVDDQDTVKLLLDWAGAYQLSDFEFDSDGKILNGIVTTADGIRQKIENGILKEFETSDGRKYIVENQTARLDEWKFKDGMVVKYGNVGIDQILFPEGKRLTQIGLTSAKEIEKYTESTGDGTQRFYENGFVVKKILADGTQIFYGTDHRVNKVVSAGGQEKRIEHRFNAAGEWAGLTVHEGNSSFAYNSEAELAQVLTSGVYADVDNGEITRLFTRFGEVENPVWNAAGRMEGELVLADGRKVILQDGKLIRVLMADGTSMDYQNGRIAKVENTEAVYFITYTGAPVLQDILVSWQKKNSAVLPASGQMSLTRFLLQYPDLQFSKTISPRPVNDAFGGDVSYSMARNFVPRSFSLQGNAGLYAGDNQFTFDGSGDAVNVSGANFDFENKNFTMEARLRLDPAKDRQAVMSDYWEGNGWIWLINPASRTVHVYDDGWGYVEFSTSAWQAGQYYEIALVRNGNQLMFFKNGVMEGGIKISDPKYTGNPSQPLSIGRYQEESYLNGQIDRLRISAGTARYTSNYSPAASYSRDAGTSLLLEFSRQEFTQLSETTPYSADAAALGKIDLAAWVNDSSRGYVNPVSGSFNPNLGNIYLGSTAYNNGYMERGSLLIHDDDLAALTSDLLDIDGDQDLDRVFMDPNTQYWWVQKFQNGSFLSPQKWEGIRSVSDPAVLANDFYSMRSHEGRHPVVLGDLQDMNGDGLPDRILANKNGGAGWQVQINNGHGFNAAVVWDTGTHPASQWNYQATYAIRVRDDANQSLSAVQPLIADLIDLDGDGLPDRVVRPLASPTPGADPYDHWFFQKNNGHGFDDTLIWEGVDHSFGTDAKTGGSLSWYIKQQEGMTDTADLQDMDGDGLPDRILLKLKNPADPNSAHDWYWQKNNGHGFEAAQLWDNSVRAVPNAPSPAMGTGIRFFSTWWSDQRWIFSDLRDVNGDGRPDRISLDHYSLTESQPHSTWWVELNNGHGFDAAAAWTGIEGDNLAQSSISQDNENFFSYSGEGAPYYVKVTSDLKDINGDQIPDRIYLKEGTAEWRAQYGTGAGFMPSQPMVIQSAQAGAVTAKFDYVHVSLRSAAAIPAAGKVLVKLWDENNSVIQTWQIADASTSWKDHYLALDTSRTSGRYLSFEWQYDSATVQTAPQILVEDAGLTALRPDASLEWLDYLLTDSLLIDQVHAASQNTLVQQLGAIASSAETFDWKTLLSADKLIRFNAEGKVSAVERANGEVIQLTELNGVITAFATNVNGTTQVQTVDPAAQAQTQVLTRDNGTPSDITDDYTETVVTAYGKIRSVSRDHENKPPVQYSYEFDEVGREIMVTYDPDTGETERSRAFDGPNGEERRVISQVNAAGMETRYTYNDRAELIRTEIYYKGRVRETFEQSMTGDGLRAVKTESGAVEFYNAQGVLKAHQTADGYFYKHEFAPAKKVSASTRSEVVILCDSAHQDCSDIPVGQRSLSVQIPVISLTECLSECETIHQVLLDSYEDKQGNRSLYAGSKLSEVDLASGVRIIFEDFFIEQVAGEDGILSDVKKPKNVLVIHPDGSINEFRSGLPYSVTTALGRSISIEPDAQASSAGRVVLKNPSSAAEFHYSQAADLWGEVMREFHAFSLPDEMMVQSEYSQDGTKLVTRLYSGGERELYGKNGKIDMVLSEQGDLNVLYAYDSADELVSVRLEGSRRTLEKSIAELKIEAESQKYEGLKQIAERKQVLNETIEGEYLVQRDRLYVLRTQIEAQRNLIASIEVKGKEGKDAIAGAMQKIDVGISQVDQAIYELTVQRVEALQDVLIQAADLKAQIELQAAQAHQEIDAKQTQIQNSIIKQEITPVVYHWYRKILGRDASRTEYEAAQTLANYSAGTFNLSVLKNQLQTSSELAGRTMEVDAIRQAVRIELINYVSLDTAGRQAAAAGLGIASDKAVAITMTEADAILRWMDNQSLHFGQSAFIALEALLYDAGKTYDRINLARDLILTDIFTGTLTPAEKSDLILSFFALSTYAARFGLAVQPLELTFDSLKQLIQEACPNPEHCGQRIAAHIDGNHYILITGYSTRIENGSVIEELHYTDPGAGPENQLEKMIMTRDEFLKTWAVSSLEIENAGQRVIKRSGYVLSPRAPPASVSRETRLLNVLKQMQIRGAFFGFIKKIFSVLFDVLIWVVDPLAKVLSYVSESVQTFFNTLKQILYTGVDILEGTLKLDFSQVYKSFKQSFKLSMSAFSQALVVPLTALGDVLMKIGVPPKVAQTVVAAGKIVVGVVLIVVGAVVGAVTGGLGAFISGVGLSLLGQGVGEILSLHTSLSPQTIQFIQLGIQAIALVVGSAAAQPGTLDWNSVASAMKSQAPTLSREFSSAGVTALGAAMEWDPRITGLLDIGVRAVVGGAADNLAKDNYVVGVDAATGQKVVVRNTKGFMDYMGDSLKSTPMETVSYGINIGLQSAGLDGQTGSMLSKALAGFAAGAGIGTSGGANPVEWAKNLISDAAQTAKKLGSMIVKTGQAVIGLAADIAQRGYNAVKNTFTALFSSRTQEVITQSSQSGGVGVGAGWVLSEKLVNYDDNMNPTSVVENYTNASGDKMRMVTGVNNGSITIQHQLANGDVFQEVYEGVARGEQGGFDVGRINFSEQLRDGIINTQYDHEGIKSISFENDGQLFWELSANDGNNVKLINNSLYEGVLTTHGDYSQKILIKEGVMQWYRAEVAEDVFMVIENSNSKYIGRMQVGEKFASAIDPADIEDKLIQLRDTFFANGINNPNPSGVSPDYANQFVQEFAGRGVALEAVALFEGTNEITGVYEVAKEMYFTSPVSKNKIKEAILNRIQQKQLAAGEKLNLILYSGAGQSGLEAAQELGDQYGVQFASIVLLDTPIFINVPLSNVENVTLIQGDLLNFSSAKLMPLGWITPFALPKPQGGIEFMNILGALKIKRITMAGYGHLDFVDEDKISEVINKLQELFYDS